MGRNKELNGAKSAKKDDFYTGLHDIEDEMRHYKAHFRGKTVLCNCDDPRESNFWKYFVANFEHLGLKKLIATCYKNQDVDLFSTRTCERAVYQVYTGEASSARGSSASDSKSSRRQDVQVHELEGDGDFRSAECQKFLDEADIVVTNPPFSLFREFVANLVAKKKKFLIIGNLNSVTCKEIFPLVKNGEMWLGASIHSGDREFRVPDNYPLNAAGFRVDEKGNKFIRVKGVRWFTNLDYKERHEDLPLYKHYTSEEYPKFDNYDAINVAQTAIIPCDYDDVMGVPITFLDKFNPSQFEILGIDRYIEDNPIPGKRFTIDGKEIYARILVRARKQVG